MKVNKRLLTVLAGYAAAYAALEITASITGDLVNPVNALIVTVVVIVVVILSELFLLRSKLSDIVTFLGLGKPSFKSIIFALTITGALFLCYPMITMITGYEFVIPGDWLWLAVGVFALHGIGEEVLYRGFLFRHLREGRSFVKAAWMGVLFFTLAHVPMIFTLGPFVGGTAVLLAVVSSFPLSWLYEKGYNTIWAPAIVHFAIDTVIPILARGGSNADFQMAAVLWMGGSMLIPYIAFLIPRKG